MHMHMFWHAPKLTQPSHRSPGSAMSAESSVGNVTNRAAKERQSWRAPIFLCEGNYRYSKKKCFSIALRHTLVVLEMH